MKHGLIMITLQVNSDRVTVVESKISLETNLHSIPTGGSVIMGRDSVDMARLVAVFHGATCASFL